MLHHSQIPDAELHPMLRSGMITFGGNRLLKIYGNLACRSGKRMNKSNRVFFTSELEAVENGYRPCGHCMRTEYLQWKSNQ